jgi:Isochorismatase family
MPQIEGSLSRRVLDIVRFGNGRVAGMVIDEQGASHEKTKEQMIMLRKLAVWRCPIFLVELQTDGPLPTKPELRLAACDDTLKEFSLDRLDRLGLRRPLLTKPERRLAACDDTLKEFSPLRTQLQCRRVTKRYANALVQTDLMEKLKADNITHVVIMGQQTNCCVRATAIGGKDFDRGPEYAGLVQHGISVLSTPKLMSPESPRANFLGNERVEIYSAM